MQNDNETLSAIVDGEIRSLDSQTLVSISLDDASRSTWARYHLMGDVMRDNLADVAPANFSEQLRIEIERQPTLLPRRGAGRRWQRPVAGFALAASVAAIAVLGIKEIGPAPASNGSDEVATVSPTPTPEELVAHVPNVAESPDILKPMPESIDTHRRLNGYLVKFNEQRSSLGVPGVNPYVRIVGFESE
jgi:sigma-E factor negative regulatory protein RseA